MKENAQEILISFCIPTFNRASTVYQCIKRILEYPGENIEVVVVDNNSPDNTQEAITSIMDSRVRYFKNDSNLGAVLNMIETYKYARGEWIFSLSDEDEVNDEIIWNIIKVIINNDYDNVTVVLGNVLKANGVYRLKYENKRYQKGDEAVNSLGFTHMYMSGIMFRRKCIYLIDLDNYSIYTDGLYPFVNIFTRACAEGDAVTLDLDLCINHERAGKKSCIEKPNNISFKDPKNRVRQFLIFSEKAYGLIEDKDLRIEKISDMYSRFLYYSTHYWRSVLHSERSYFELSDSTNIKFFKIVKNFNYDARNGLEAIIGDAIERDTLFKKFDKRLIRFYIKSLGIVLFKPVLRTFRSLKSK